MPGGTRELSNSSDMPRTSTLASNDIIAGMKASGAPAAFRGSLFLAVAAGWTLAATWSELSGIAGTRSGQPGRVMDDEGTHTDPVSGQTVPNMGEYAWTGSAWRRVGDLESNVGEFAPVATFVQDWNTISESGVYRSNSNGSAPDNGPGNYGHMICEHMEAANGRAFQMAYRTTGAVIAPYFRAREGEGVWGPWRQLLSDTPQSLMPGVLTTRDLSDQYPDPEMEDLSFYTLTGAETLSRTSGPANRRSAYHIFHELVAVETSIVSGLFPASAGLSYLVTARTTFTTGLPVDRAVYIDWYSDYAGTTLISSDLVSEWTGTASARRTASLTPPASTVRARFRAVKAESVEGTRIIISEYSFKKQVAAEDVVPGAVLPSKLTTRDFNSYPDPSMEDLPLYTMTGADNLTRFAGTSFPYLYNNDMQAGVIEIVSPVVPITGDTAYEFAARLSFTSSLPVVRELYIDWYADLAATELLDSSLFSRWEQYESAYRTMVVRSPGGAVRARLRAVKLASDVPTRIIVASYSVRPIPASDESVRFADERARRSMEINGNLPAGGDFPRTADQEIETVFGGNTSRQRPPLAAMDLGECMFIPPTEEQMNFAGPTVPLMAWHGATFRMIPMDIRTSLFSTPVGPPLFNPHLTNNSGILVFNYFRTDPIHTVMKGSIDMMAMVSRDDPDARMRYILGIKGFDTPYLEKGQGSARRYLAQSIPYGDTAKRILDVEAYNDLCAPIDDFILSQFASGSPNLYAGSDHGFLNPSQVDTWDVDPATGLYLSDDSGPVGPEVQTTKWIDISDYDPLDHVYAITFDGTSNRSRIQWRDENNDVFYFTGHSIDRSSYRLIRLPRRAKAFRVYYTGRNRTAGDNAVDIRALTGQALDYDPLKGYFQNFHFSVNRDVTFWPGAAYGFFIFQQRFAGSFPTAADTPEWGFRFQSGGLSMLFDAGRLRRTMATSLYRAV